MESFVTGAAGSLHSAEAPLGVLHGLVVDPGSPFGGLRSWA